jgi:hypothetical protein
MIKVYVFETVSDALSFEHPLAISPSPTVKPTPEVTDPAPVSHETDTATETPRRQYKRKNKKAKPEKEEFKERILKKAKSKVGGARNCKNCGKPGHMSKTCPELKKGEPELTQEQINHIKELSESGQTIAQIVMETGLPSKVVKENMY